MGVRTLSQECLLALLCLDPYSAGDQSKYLENEEVVCRVLCRDLRPSGNSCILPQKAFVWSD